MSKFGSIVLIPFPFTDLSSAKLRPALVISGKEDSDIICLFITTQKYPESIEINSDESIFELSGLKTTSYIRMNKIATLNKKIVLGELGVLPAVFLQKYKNLFFEQFGF